LSKKIEAKLEITLKKEVLKSFALTSFEELSCNVIRTESFYLLPLSNLHLSDDLHEYSLLLMPLKKKSLTFNDFVSRCAK